MQVARRLKGLVRAVRPDCDMDLDIKATARAVDTAISTRHTLGQWMEVCVRFAESTSQARPKIPADSSRATRLA